MPARRAIPGALLAFFTSCSTFGGNDAGPTTGTFHVEISGGSGTTPATFDAQSLFANTWPRPPTDWLCPVEDSQGQPIHYTEVIAVNGFVRAYIRLNEGPPAAGMHTVTANSCGTYFTMARYPGLPYAERWDPTGGTLTISNVNGQSFDITITNATFDPGPGTTGSFTVNVSAHIVNALPR